MKEPEISCYGVKQGMIGDVSVIEYLFAVNQLPIRTVMYLNERDVSHNSLIQEACTYTFFHYMNRGV